MFLILRDSTISIWIWLLAFFVLLLLCYAMMDFPFIEISKPNRYVHSPQFPCSHFIRFFFFSFIYYNQNKRIRTVWKVCFCSVCIFFFARHRQQAEYACTLDG